MARIDRSVRGQILREIRAMQRLDKGVATYNLLTQFLARFSGRDATDEIVLRELKEANVRFYMVRNKATGEFARSSWASQPIAGKLYRRLADAQMLANRRNRRWSANAIMDWEVVVTNAPIQFVPIQG